MNNKEDKTINYLESFLSDNSSKLEEHIHSLIKEYKRKSRRLDVIIKQSDIQQKQLLEFNEELDSYKNHLEIKVEEEIQKREEKEKMLLQQSKMAAMGEMIDAVAHQWKQPISNINILVGMINYDYEDNLIDKEYIKKLEYKINSQITHMADTLDEFRSFFRPDKGIEVFNIGKMINKVLVLIQDEFKRYKINITVNTQDNFNMPGIQNEFQHLVINILNNAKDAFIDNNIENRHISINILKDNNINKIEIIDNAGGVPQAYINDIFTANYSTKEEGTGIGLYMSKLISDKHGGNLRVDNVNGGAKFTFEYYLR